MLRSLAIRHFRCFEKFGTEFAPGLNLIVGPNAHGKTSLLEAACILLRLQSPRASRLTEVVQHDRRGFVVDGYFGERHLQFYYSAARRKLALDGVEQKVPREYLEVGRLVYFAMSDIDLVRGSGDTRRRFLDFVAAQRDPSYRKAGRDYERALRSRNALLKAPSPRWREIEAFDGPLLAAGNEVSRARAELIAEMQPHAGAAHAGISGAREDLELEYLRGAGADFAVSLAEARAEDARLRQTTVGPHRDDVQFRLNGRASTFASEGQQRTLVLALKLGAARLIEERFGVAPLLLLDDIFGELDTGRRLALLEALPAAAQKIITTTTLAWWQPEQTAQVLRLGGEG
jgi:DNA replication and repair protein RecF